MVKNTREPNPSDVILEQAMAEINKNAKASRKQLIRILEIHAQNDNIDLEMLRQLYTKCTSDPMLSLIQDIQLQLTIYSNILEEIKSQSPLEAGKRESPAAASIREKYEKLGLIEVGVLSNSPLSWLAERAVGQIKSYGKMLLKAIAEHGKEIIQELSLEKELTAILQVQLGVPPTVTIGIEQSAGS